MDLGKLYDKILVYPIFYYLRGTVDLTGLLSRLKFLRQGKKSQKMGSGRHRQWSAMEGSMWTCIHILPPAPHPNISYILFQVNIPRVRRQRMVLPNSKGTSVQCGARASWSSRLLLPPDFFRTSLGKLTCGSAPAVDVATTVMGLAGGVFSPNSVLIGLLELSMWVSVNDISLNLGIKQSAPLACIKRCGSRGTFAKTHWKRSVLSSSGGGRAHHQEGQRA